MRQGAEPAQIFRCQFIASPDRGGSGHGIEVVKVQKPSNCLVMIAAHEDFSKVAGTGDYVVRTSPVPDDVSEIHHYIERRSSGEGGFKSFQIGMDVAQQQYSQESPDKLPIID